MSDKVLALIHNKDERAVVRGVLSTSYNASMISSLSEAREELRKAGEPFHMLVLDERFNESVDPKHRDLRVTDILEAFQESPRRADKAVVVILLNEASGIEEPVQYAEYGAEVFLHRPLGGQELKARLTEAAKWIQDPPALAKLVRAFSTFVVDGTYDQAVPGLESMYTKNPHNVRIGMLLAKSLIGLGGEARQRGLGIARSLDGRYPGSLFAKRLLLEVYVGDGMVVEAFDVCSRLYKCSPSDAVFAQSLELAHGAFEKRGGDFGVYRLMLEAVAEQDPAHTRQRRIDLFRAAAERKPSLNELPALVELIDARQEDIFEELEPILEGWILQARQAMVATGQTNLEDFILRGLKRILAHDPTRPKSLEAYVDILLDRKDVKNAEKALVRAREGRHPSVEYYSSFARLALTEGQLKEASDYIHQGRRLAPSDDRWDVLAKRWQELYAKRQESA